METNIFRPMVVEWSDKLIWSEDELKQALKLLTAISKANGGETAPDVEVNDETRNKFALQQAENALARRIALHAKELRAKLVPPRFTKPANTLMEHIIPELVSHEWHDCVNINTNDVDSLMRLSGIGNNLALRIIEYRQTIGSFSKIEQLIEVDGIGNEKFDALKDQAYCGPTEEVGSLTAELSSFIREPSFKNYVELLIDSKNAAALPVSDNENPKQQIIAELEKALEDIKKNPYGVAKNLHFTRASSVLVENTRKARAKATSEKAVKAINSGALLYDVNYFDFLEKLIEQATQSIRVMMFFMKYEEETDYATNSLVKALINAHANGLDVKVILDRDVEGGRTNAQLVNQSVFDVLKKSNIPVVFDCEDRMTHSKFVIVDGKHTVLGSHNWTGGSYWAYDDTSVYIESEELALKYQDIFSGFWDEYIALENASKAN